ncbi:MAG: serine/threonine protein kinase [Acidimicrobiia bacterium]
MTAIEGTPLGRYEVRARVHGSETTTVVDGRETATGRRVWITFLSPDQSADPAVATRIRDVAARIGALRDSRLVTVDEIVERDGRLGMVTDAPNATLADLLAGGRRFPPDQAARLGREIAEALTVAHAAGIVHGALTPTTVVQRADGHLALRDLGFATTPTAVVDAPTWQAFAAPEQIHDGSVDARSDLYALGSLLFLMLTGRTPFAEFDADVLARRKLEENAPPPSRDEPLIPAAFDALVTTLLARDPARRPASAAEVAAALEPFTRNVVPAPAPSRTVVTEILETPEEPPDRTWWWVAAAALVVVGLVIALVVANEDDDAPRRVTVPSVVGAQLADATRTLSRDGFGVSNVTAPSATATPGAVVTQEPAAGSRVRPHRMVVLTVSSGTGIAPTPPPIVVVPGGSNESSSTTTSTTTTSTPTTSTTTPPST